MAFLLSTPSPKYGISSPIMAEALAATMLCLLIRVCADRLEKVGASKMTGGPLLDKTTSYIRHEDFLRSSSPILRHTQGTAPLDSETGLTGELWSNCVILILEN